MLSRTIINVSWASHMRSKVQHLTERQQGRLQQDIRTVKLVPCPCSMETVSGQQLFAILFSPACKEVIA